MQSADKNRKQNRNKNVFTILQIIYCTVYVLFNDRGIEKIWIDKI